MLLIGLVGGNALFPNSIPGIWAGLVFFILCVLAFKQSELEEPKSHRQERPKQDPSPNRHEYYCGVLNVNPYASQELIKTAYKTQMQKHHPDKAEGEQATQWATEKFKEIQEAYEFLSSEANNIG